MTINSILLMNYVIFFLRCQIKIDNFDKTFPKRCRSFVRRRWERLPGGIHRRRNPEKTEINISTLRVVASEGKYKHKDTKNVTLYEITSMPAVKRACLRRVTFSSWVIWLRSAWSAQQPKDSTLKDHEEYDHKHDHGHNHYRDHYLDHYHKHDHCYHHYHDNLDQTWSRVALVGQVGLQGGKLTGSVGYGTGD